MLGMSATVAVLTATLMTSTAPAPAVVDTPTSVRLVAGHRSAPVACVRSYRSRYRGRLLVTGQFCGRHLRDREIAAVLYRAGFRGRALIDMTATTLAESNGYDRTVRFNRDRSGRVTSIDYGAFQINDRWHPAIRRIRRGDTLAEARLAYSIARVYGLRPWGGYAHRFPYLRRAARAAGLGR